MLLLCLLASLPICIVAHEEECSAALQVPRASTTTTTTEKQQHAFQIATASEKIGEPFTAKDVAEALATATQHLQRQHVLKLNDTCGECPVPDTRTECCVVWIQDGVEKKPERLELVGEMKKVIELRVTLHHEEGFDADLLRWVRTLHFDSADDRYQFLNKLRRDGIFEQSQLMSLNPFLMPTAKDVQLTSRLQQKAWIEQGKKQSSKEGEKARKEELSKKLQELESKNKDTREQMKAFYEAARSEAKASRAGLEEEAKKMQQEMAQRLEKLQLDASDTSMEDIRKQMSQLTETSGYLGGMSLPMVGLLHHMGVFRGVDLLADEMALGQHSQVVSLSPELASMDDEQLQRALQVAPDIAMEFTVETEFASDMQKVSTRLEAFGTSSFTSKSWQHSISAGGGMPLIFSVNTNGHWSGTESKGDATENKSEHGHQERDKVKSRQKMKCYEEPKARINLDHFMLVPSRSFSTAVAAISQELCRSESTNCSNFDRIQELLWTYGSHVCPQVVLGGRWTITAVYTSREATDKDDVSEMLSTAIDKVSAHSRGGGVGASAIFEAFQLGGGYSGEHQDGNSSHNHSSSGSRKLEQEAASQSHIRVEQVWTGGSSGLGPDGWRQSLDSVKNSNWKVIDRTLARCFGIWTWVDDIPTSEAICQQWVAQLGQMYSSDVKGAIETAALSMPDFPAKEVCQHTQKMRDFTDKAPVFRANIRSAMSTWPLTRLGCLDSDRSFYALGFLECKQAAWAWSRQYPRRIRNGSHPFGCSVRTTGKTSLEYLYNPPGPGDTLPGGHLGDHLALICDGDMHNAHGRRQVRLASDKKWCIDLHNGLLSGQLELAPCQQSNDEALRNQVWFFEDGGVKPWCGKGHRGDDHCLTAVEAKVSIRVCSNSKSQQQQWSYISSGEHPGIGTIELISDEQQTTGKWCLTVLGDGNSFEHHQPVGVKNCSDAEYSNQGWTLQRTSDPPADPLGDCKEW